MNYTYEVENQIVVSTCRPADDQWLDTQSAARILGVTDSCFFNAFNQGNNYHEVRRRLRGSNGKQSPRGQGNLFHIHDLLEIKRIRKHIASSVGVAGRVFAAQEKGLI